MLAVQRVHAGGVARGVAGIVCSEGTTIIAPRYSMMFAGSTLATLPLLVVFFLFRRQLIEGIMSGAVKG